MTVKILQGRCITLLHYKGLGKKSPCDPWPELTTAWLTPLTLRLSCAGPLHSPSPKTGAHRHTVIQGIQMQTEEMVSFTVLCWSQVTLSQKSMKIPKAPETIKLVISSTQVCLTLIYCCMSWTTKALLCCQTWKPYIRESQSLSKI